MYVIGKEDFTKKFIQNKEFCSTYLLINMKWTQVENEESFVIVFSLILGDIFKLKYPN